MLRSVARSRGIYESASPETNGDDERETPVGFVPNNIAGTRLPEHAASRGGGCALRHARSRFARGGFYGWNVINTLSKRTVDLTVSLRRRWVREEGFRTHLGHSPTDCIYDVSICKYASELRFLLTIDARE